MRLKAITGITLTLILASIFGFTFQPKSIRATDNLPCTVFDDYHNGDRLTEAEVSPLSRRIWYGNGYHWVVCDVAWKTTDYFVSANLSNWEEGTYIPVVGRHSHSTTWKGNKVHCVDGGGRKVTYAQGIIENSTINWGDMVTVVENLTADTVHWVQGTVDTDDIPWTIYAWDGVNIPQSEFGVWVVNATNSTATEWNDPVRFIQANGGWWFTQIVPLPDGKVYVTYSEYAEKNHFYGQLWNGTGWENKEQIVADQQIFSHCTTVLNDTIYVAYMGGWYNLYFVERNSASEWSSPVLIATANNMPESNPAISVDANTGDIYIFWIPWKGNKVFYRRRISGQWDDSATIWYQEDDMIHSRQISCSLQSYDNIIGVAWMKNTDSPYELRYSYLNVATPLPVGGIYIPVNKLELLAPYIGLTILLAVAVMTVIYIKRRKRYRD